jgi:hypothetical protein
MIMKELIGPRPVFSAISTAEIGVEGRQRPRLRRLPAVQQRLAAKDPPQPVMRDLDAAGLGDLNETA